MTSSRSSSKDLLGREEPGGAQLYILSLRPPDNVACNLLINCLLDELSQFLQAFYEPFFLHDLGCRSEDKIRVRSDPMIDLWNELASFAAYIFSGRNAHADRNDVVVV